jgi:RND family efflux transporter MFP subunit
MSPRKKWISRLVPAGILLAGVAAFALLKSSAAPPERVEQAYLGPLVQTAHFPAGPVQVMIEGQGTVRPSAQIDLVSQVSGVVVWKSPKLEGGGYFVRGEELLRIEAEDYELAVDQAHAQVAQAGLRLEQAREQAAVARQEWELLHPGQEGSPLALYVPQLQAAEADLKAAQARMGEAQLRLRRTRLQAPFAGRVRQSRVEAGQFVSPGQPLAQLYSTEQAEIAVPLPDEDLGWFAVPGLGSAPADPNAVWRPGESGAGGKRAERAGALVKGWHAGQPHQWQGRVARAEGEVDPQSRMVSVVVEIEDPQGQAEAPLLVGAFVEVAIAGRQLEGVRTLPRAALRQDNTVWVATPEGILRVRPVQVVRPLKEEVLVRAELSEGERIILTSLSGVSDGMKVRVAEEAQL